MAEIRKEIIVGKDVNGNVTRVVRYVQKLAEKKESEAVKIIEAIWYIVGVGEVMLALRILFHLFGARLNPFTLFLYGITSPLVAPFLGTFRSPQLNGGYLDTSAIVAMVIIGIFAWGLVELLWFFRKPDNS